MFNFILSPGVFFISRLTFARKLLVVFLLYIVPVVYASVVLITSNAQTHKSTQSEIETVKVIKLFEPIFVNMAKSRGLTNAYLNGNTDLAVEIEQAQSKVNQQFAKILSSNKSINLNTLVLSKLPEINEQWLSLIRSSQEMSPEESFSAHNILIFEILNLIRSLMEQSPLLTDSQPHTSFMIRNFVEDLPLLADMAGQTRGFGAGVAASGKLTDKSMISLTNNINQLRSLNNRISRNFESAILSNPSLESLAPLLSNLQDDLNQFIDSTKDELIEKQPILLSSKDYFSQGTKVIKVVMSVYDASYNQLVAALSKRESDLNMQIWINFISSFLLIAAGIYLFASFYKNMLDSIKRIENCVNQVADGDLTAQVKINSSDEMSNIGNDVNQMVEHTRALVFKVLNTTKELVNSADLNSQFAQQTSEQINQQNIEVEQVATAMNEMSSTVQEVARNAEATAHSSASADKDSHIGFDIVQDTIKSIDALAEEITNSSRSIDELQNDVNKISSVLDVIQGIADQTNLLALNAAIEAARAGETGRGFAVVADEVRTLASKTQESTEEIRNMINKLQDSAHRSVNSMENGNEKSLETVDASHAAGDALKKISESVGHISLMSEQIAAAATEQSTVAEEINRSIISVRDISELTQQSAKDSSQNSQFVDQSANDLQEIVKHFKV